MTTTTPWPLAETVATARLLIPGTQPLHRRGEGKRTACGRRWTFRLSASSTRGALADGFLPCEACQGARASLA